MKSPRPSVLRLRWLAPQESEARAECGSCDEAQPDRGLRSVKGAAAVTPGDGTEPEPDLIDEAVANGVRRSPAGL
jgi:hypothetical protein